MKQIEPCLAVRKHYSSYYCKEMVSLMRRIHKIIQGFIRRQLRRRDPTLTK